MTNIEGTLPEFLFTFMISPRVLLKMRNIPDKFIGKINTHFMLKNLVSQKSSFYEIMWKNIVVLNRLRMTI
jgi:hypothetical protein